MEDMKICLKKPDDVKEFVRAARKCDFDVDLAYNSAVVDGKSILGVFAIAIAFPSLLLLSPNPSKIINIVSLSFIYFSYYPFYL